MRFVVTVVLLSRIARASIVDEQQETHALPERVEDLFLRSVVSEFDMQLEREQGHSENPLYIQGAIHEIVDGSIRSGRPRYQVNLLSNIVRNFTNSSEEHDPISMAHQLFLVPGVNLMDYLEPRNPFMQRVMQLAQRVGVSANDVRKYAETLVSHEDSGLIDRLEDLFTEAVSENSVAAELRELVGPSSSQFKNLSTESSRQRVESFRGNSTRDFPMLVDALSIVMAVPDDCRDSVEGQRLALNDTLAQVSFMLDHGADAEYIRNLDIDISGPILEELRGLKESMRAKREELIEKVMAVDSGARIVIVPWLVALIESTLALPVIPRRFELLRATLDALVRVLGRAENEVSLVAVTEFLERNSRMIRGYELHDSESFESTVIQIAFDFARFFGVRFLLDYPGLLPGWPQSRVIGARQIMGSFLQLNGQHDWQRFKVFEIIPKLPEALFPRAVRVLTALFIKRSDSVDQIPLVNSAQWLRDFASNSTSKYSMFVEDLIIPGLFLPQIEWNRSLFSQTDREIFEFAAIPKRFFDMADRAHALRILRTGDIPQAVVKRALALPAKILRLEVIGGYVHEENNRAVVMAERSAWALFDILEAIGEVGFSNISEDKKRAVNQCFHFAASAIPRLLEQGRYLSLENATERFLANVSELIYAINIGEAVALSFVDMPHHF